MGGLQRRVPTVPVAARYSAGGDAILPVTRCGANSLRYRVSYLGDMLLAQSRAVSTSSPPSKVTLRQHTEVPEAYESARQPEDLGRSFVQRANAANVDELVALYELSAGLSLASGEVAIRTETIRAFYTRRLAPTPRCEPGPQSPATRNGYLAMTSMRLVTGGATAEVAHRQSETGRGRGPSISRMCSGRHLV